MEYPQIAHTADIADPAAEPIISELRRRLDEVGVIADLSTARHAEAQVLRSRLEAVLAARRFEVDALRRRIAELEARPPGGGHGAPAVPPDAVPSYSALAGEFRERLAERSADITRRYEERIAAQRAALEEKDERIRRLTEQIAAADAEIRALGGPPAVPPLDPHDLQRISGIGPVLAGTLRSLGISTLHQVASLTDADLARIDDGLEAFKGRSRRDRWVEQARDLIGSG